MATPKISPQKPESGIQADFTDSQHVEPLRLAIAPDLEFLAQNPHWTGENSMFHGIENNCPQALDVLLDVGVGHSFRDPLGLTPLHLACSAGRDECVALLILAGADLKAQSVDGSLPADCALRNDHGLSLGMLLMAGAELPDLPVNNVGRFSAILTSMNASLWKGSVAGQQFAADLQRRDIAQSIEARCPRPRALAPRI